MKVDKLYDQLSSEEQYRLTEREDLLSPRFPRSLFAYENRFQIVTSAISKVVAKSRSKISFLDVGCGDGVYEKLLSKGTTQKMKLIGVDFSAKQLKKAAKYLDKTYKVDLDSDRLPLLDKSIDFAICSEVLEHLFFPEKIISEIHRVLKPRGRLLITVPNFSSAQTRISLLLNGRSPMVNYSENKEHIRFYSLHDIDYLLGSKFKKEDVKGIGSFLFARWNSTIKLPLPKFIQDFGDRFLPTAANGIMVVSRKK